MNNNNGNNQSAQQPKTPAARPNETGSISVEGHVRIFDPATKQVFVEKRA
jgi:hypothetical protein